MAPDQRLKQLELRTHRLLVAVTALSLTCAWLFLTHPATHLASLHAETQDQQPEDKPVTPPVALEPVNNQAKPKEETVSEVVRTRRVEIVNQAGIVVASLGTGTTDGGKLNINSPDGTPRVLVTMNYEAKSKKHGGSLLLLNEDDCAGAAIETDALKGTGRLSINAADGTVLANMAAAPPNRESSQNVADQGNTKSSDEPQPSPACWLLLRDYQQKTRVWLTAIAHEGQIELFGQQERMGTAITPTGVKSQNLHLVYPDGNDSAGISNGRLSLFSPEGKQIIEAGGDDVNKNGLFVVNDSQGTPVCKIGSVPHRDGGGGFINVKDRNGKDIFSLESSVEGQRTRFLMLKDRNTKALVGMALIDGKPALQLVDSQGNVVWSAP